MCLVLRLVGLALASDLKVSRRKVLFWSILRCVVVLFSSSLEDKQTNKDVPLRTERTTACPESSFGCLFHPENCKDWMEMFVQMLESFDIPCHLGLAVAQNSLFEHIVRMFPSSINQDKVGYTRSNPLVWYSKYSGSVCHVSDGIPHLARMLGGRSWGLYGTLPRTLSWRQ